MKRPLCRTVLIILACLWTAGVAGARAACLPGAAETVTIAAVNDRMELVTDKGTLLRLDGVENLALDPDADDALYDVTESLREWLVGTTVLMRRVTPSPDRWQRLDAEIFAPSADNGDVQSVALRLVAAGKLRVAPEAGETACLADLLAAEAMARAEKRGIWTDAIFGPLSADNRDALSAKLGKFVIVEGDVVGTGESRTRLYLNFGASRWRDLAVTILRRDEKAFEKAGISLKSLAGARLRIRGILGQFYGPEIEITTPAAVEIVAKP
ncbi:thermonuclease family protein [Methylovirgula sp. 4M-Z18]|uniref:thermonuclease family protein n=1 Tax=Methylovirgula sp. 4M-Z18 TaxID=2293567 RepID=UPI000E2F0B8C|nr:hypothetical protein [Methylovirgula sp. 4M-Z18]RFB79029.1 hypothetical protein DYH55_14530 [Methylovirgula sp. 4M-Z18]